MDIATLIRLVDSELPAARASEGYVATALPGLGVLRLHRPTPIEATVYEPVVCLILQGRKETRSGSLRAALGPGDSLIVSHDLPVVSRVTEAPYLALLLTLDPGLLRDLLPEVAPGGTSGLRATALDVDRAGPELLDALARYLALHRKPAEARVLAPLVRREIHFRLLAAPNGRMLGRVAAPGAPAEGIARAIAILRERFRSRLEIPSLAREIGMSESAFHRHFKTVTGTTPLQYQKEMRLLEARRLISSEGLAVYRAALEVGYGSSTQFTREYGRKFGAPPRLDAGSAREARAR